jgi:DNA-binding LytR/AlgR family response regulator
MKLNCLIIDDEPVARKGLAEYAKDVEFLNVVAQCENAMKASTFLQEGKIDLLFLDIQMPKLSGVDFLKSLKNPPMTIFTTAFSEYALEGYSLDVIDYLIKPISFERFLKAVHKAYDFYKMKNNAVQATENYFFVKSNGRIEKVDFSEILYVESLQNYVTIHTKDRKLITYLTLSGLESQLPADRFMKVHKSFLVASAKIESIDGNELIIGKARVPISRTLKDEVLQKIVGKNLLKR